MGAVRREISQTGVKNQKKGREKPHVLGDSNSKIEPTKAME
jgi:hypothetical protein